MNELSTQYNTLAIVGNGFDLAHHYKTTYDNFIEEVGFDYFSKYRDYLNTYCGSDSEWSNFEKKVEIIIYAFYQKMFVDYEIETKIIPEFNRVFLNIKKELIDYLSKEIRSKKFNEISSVKKYLGNNTVVMNFNYTNVVENYTSHLIYIHGSIEENEIVLGYDSPDPLCLASYNNRKWFKVFGRERLAFIRFIKQSFNLSSADTLYRELLNEFEQIQTIKNSGKGLETEDILKQKHADIFSKYFSTNSSADILNPLGEITTHIQRIIVLGHSLKSDETFLKGILDKCINLHEVILFSYEEEKKEELNKKIQFFDPYCTRVKIEKY